MNLVYTREKFLCTVECEQWRRYWAAEQAIGRGGAGGIVGRGGDAKIRRSQVVLVQTDLDINRELFLALRRANEFMHLDFDIKGIETLQIAEYAVGDRYDWHMDYGPQHASLRKLSASVQLSAADDYDGGDLELWNSGAAPRGVGDLVVFPSFLPHRVTPVTRGVRYSLVAWAIGERSFR